MKIDLPRVEKRYKYLCYEDIVQDYVYYVFYIDCGELKHQRFLDKAAVDKFLVELGEDNENKEDQKDEY